MACNSAVIRPLSVLACVALLVAVSFWQQEWLQPVIGEGHEFGRRMREGQVHEGQGEEGHGHEGQGQEGQEREGQGDEGPGHEVTGKWSSSNLVAIMLFIFIGLTIFFVYFVFLDDPDIRKAIYTMLSSTMSIFIAVVINTAAFSFFLKQVIAGKGWNHFGPISFPRGLGLDIGFYGEFIVSALLFLWCQVAVSWGVFCAAKNENARCAVRVIGGHLLAFAGIITAGSLQIKADEGGAMRHHHYAFVLVSLLVYCMLRCISGLVRDCWFRQLASSSSTTHASDGFACFDGSDSSDDSDSCDVSDGSSGSEGSEADELQKGMKEAISEASNDAFSLIFGFLITQLAVWKATGHLMPLHPTEHHHKVHSQHQVGVMLAFFAGAIAFLGVFAFLEKVPFLKSFLHSDDPTSAKSTVRACGPLTCLMTCSWIALVAATWQVQIWLNGTPLSSHEMAEVFSAFFLTIVAVMCIYILDKVGDQLKKRARVEFGEFIEENKDIEFIEKVVRKIIEAFGVLVGLTWEKACHGALDTVIESVPMLEARPVWSSFGAAVVLSLYILPAWYKHILPMANKKPGDHEMALDVALIHRLHWEGKIKEYIEADDTEKDRLRKALIALKEMVKKLEEDLQ